MEGKKYFGSLKGWILLVFYVVGFFGLHTPAAAFFNKLTPLLLCLNLGLLLSEIKGWDLSLGMSLLLAALIGFFAEVLGVNTGLLFGNYSYGSILGPKWAGTPLVLAVNWLLLGYSFSAICGSFIKHKLGAAMVAAVLMTGLDFLIEPLAIKLGWWSWDGGSIPLRNYLAWLLTGFLVAYLLLGLNKNLKPNVLAWWTVVLQGLFFGGFLLWP